TVGEAALAERPRAQPRAGALAWGGTTWTSRCREGDRGSSRSPPCSSWARRSDAPGPAGVRQRAVSAQVRGTKEERAGFENPETQIGTGVAPVPGERAEHAGPDDALNAFRRRWRRNP